MRFILFIVLSVFAYPVASIIAADMPIEAAADPQVQVMALAENLPAPPAEAPWWFGLVTEMMGNFPEVNGWLLAVMVFMSVVLRATADLLGFVSVKTQGKGDDKAYQLVSKAALWAGVVLGWFGGGKSKLIEKAKEGKAP